MSIRKILWPAVLVATTVLIGCQDMPSKPDWGPQKDENPPDGHQRFLWGPSWEFRSAPSSEATTDPGLIILLRTFPTPSFPVSRCYQVTVEATTGTLTNAVRTFTTLSQAISCANELLDDAGFTGDEDNRADLESWRTTE